jgi:hypothetical protein
MKIKCINHACQLSAACVNFMNKDGEERYIRPNIQYDGFMQPKMVCYYLMPFQTSYIVRQSKMNNISKLEKLKLVIVDEFGGEYKQKLMKLLKKLETL